jgi:hypothetical protein
MTATMNRFDVVVYNKISNLFVVAVVTVEVVVVVVHLAK